LIPSSFFFTFSSSSGERAHKTRGFSVLMGLYRTRRLQTRERACAQAYYEHNLRDKSMRTEARMAEIGDQTMPVVRALVHNVDDTVNRLTETVGTLATAVVQLDAKLSCLKPSGLAHEPPQRLSPAAQDGGGDWRQVWKDWTAEERAKDAKNSQDRRDSSPMAPAPSSTARRAGTSFKDDAEKAPSGAPATRERSPLRSRKSTKADAEKAPSGAPAARDRSVARGHSEHRVRAPHATAKELSKKLG
jgi:hypothetical protein